VDVWNQEIPDEIGKYTILERIDVGGMAEVFLGVDQQNELVAIKRILPHIAMKDQLVSMFIDEWRITAKLKHPNIARIHDFGRAEKLYFMAMEYINGVDLRLIKHQFKILRETGDSRLTPLAAYILAHVCGALDYAYSRQDEMGQPMRIVHRDISPSNVLLSFDGEIKLIDFGVAKAAQRVYKNTSKDLKGKFAYMSPEQARGKEVDNRSDIFGAGILLYELLTGKNPFATSGGEFDTLERIATMQAPPPATLAADVPPELNLCCQRALALDPEDRYGSAQTMENVLRRYYEREGFDEAELIRWLRAQLPNQYEKSLLVACQEGDRVAVASPDSSGARWDMLANQEAPTTQRQASGELAQPVAAQHSSRTSWLAIGIAAVVVLAAGLVVMQLMQDEPARPDSAPAVSATPAPEKAPARPTPVPTPAPVPPVTPKAGKPAPAPAPAPKEHTIIVSAPVPGAQCRALLGDEKLVLKPAPCRLVVRAGIRIELKVLAKGWAPFIQTWTVTSDRRVKPLLMRPPGTRVPTPRKQPVPAKAPPAPAVDLPAADQAKPNPVLGPGPAPKVKVIRALGPEPDKKKALKPAPKQVPAPGVKPAPKQQVKPKPAPGVKPTPKQQTKPKPAPKKPKPAKKKGLEDGAADWD